MQQGYFKTAWNDIKESPGWKGKMFLLALISFIPIFGQIVVFGYLFTWAKDAAWGVRSPLPKHVFGNVDGKLYSRGFYILILSIVLSFIPGASYMVYLFFSGMAAAIFSGTGSSGYPVLFAFGAFGMIFSVLSIVLSFFVTLFSWVGSMRISVYDNLSAGFQIKKIWAMIRHDFGGLLRILGVMVLLSAIVVLILYILIFLVIAVMIALGIAFSGGNMGMGMHFSNSSVIAFILAFGAIALLVIAAVAYLGAVAAICVEAVAIRSVGHWTRQFDVAQWRAQDDPMPFELQNSPGEPGHNS